MTVAQATDSPPELRRPVVVLMRPNLFGDPAGRLAPFADVRTWPEDAPPDEEALVELAAGAAGILGIHGDPFTASVLNRLVSLRVLALASVGYDWADVSAATARGIVVTNTPGVLHEATADLAFGLILATRRRLVEADRFVRDGRWTSASLHLLVGLDVHGATLGLVGYGEIGRAVARRAQGFGMTVLHTTRTRTSDALSTWVPLDELLERSDIVSLHLPLSEATKGLVGERQLRRMKPTATLINTARGAIVDEAALVRALTDGWIGSAGLDVQSIEPNPDAASPLLGLSNVVVLPHIGSASITAREAQISLAVQNIEAVLAGRPPLTPVRAIGAPG